MRSSLVAAIYRKSLNLSPDSRREHGSGEITNFVSVDCQELLDSVPFLSHSWADPLQVFLVVVFLYVELGVSALAGVAFIILLVPINMLGARKIEECQEKILETKDERMKLTNETLVGMLVIKLSAWEPAFARRIRSLRDSEVGLLRKMAKLFALASSTFSNAPVFVSLIVFAVYVATDPVAHVLTPEKIFVSISLFSLLRLPLELFPVCIFDMIRMFISLKRIGKFLNSEELDAAAVSDNTLDHNNAVEIDGGCFGWTTQDENEDGSDSKNTLENVDLNIRKGSLVAVVGRVGSGKSTLLSAILGEAVKRQGSVSVDGAISYVPQQAWILNATVKDNVLFGSSGERTNYYRRVLSACGLEDDLNLLPEGDDTEIGEEGVTLSGGQKQRVSLARATFADRDVYLLDDPLSALDAHVGKHVFENLLSNKRGLLRGKTRVLITHSINYLDRMDRIVVVHEGRIAEQVSDNDTMLDVAVTIFKCQHSIGHV